MKGRLTRPFAHIETAVGWENGENPLPPIAGSSCSCPASRPPVVTMPLGFIEGNCNHRNDLRVTESQSANAVFDWNNAAFDRKKNAITVRTRAIHHALCHMQPPIRAPHADFSNPLIADHEPFRVASEHGGGSSRQIDVDMSLLDIHRCSLQR